MTSNSSVHLHDQYALEKQPCFDFDTVDTPKLQLAGTENLKSSISQKCNGTRVE